jgi:hypothetical protein
MKTNYRSIVPFFVPVTVDVSPISIKTSLILEVWSGTPVGQSLALACPLSFACYSPAHSSPVLTFFPLFSPLILWVSVCFCVSGCIKFPFSIQYGQPTQRTFLDHVDDS